jgi:integrase
MGRKRKTNHNLPHRVVLNHGAYYFVHHTGKWQRLAKVGDEAEMRRAWVVLCDPAETSGTMSALLDDYLVYYKPPRKAERTYSDNLKEAELLRAFFGEMLPASIMPFHVADYLKIRGETAPVRANREKALLSHVYTYAMATEKWGRQVVINPCRGVRRNPEKRRERIIEHSEFDLVKSLAAKPVRVLMELIYRTAQRPEDLIIASKADIKTVEINGVATRVLRIKQKKTKALVDIIITPELDEVLTDAMSGKVVGTTFVHNEKGRKYTYSGLTSMFWRYVQKASLTDFGLYDIKAMSATDMYRNGVPIEQISRLLGHDSVTTTEIYIKARMTDAVMPNKRNTPTAKQALRAIE